VGVFLTIGAWGYAIVDAYRSAKPITAGLG
jgi:hypothetical protein